jgi:protein involved in polysaccharide export with SLBB domain
MPVNAPNLGGDYVVDVGDEFSMMLTGASKVSASNSDKQMVQRDGTILIPNIGKLSVAGMTLGEAEKAIVDYLKITSPGVTPFVSLSKVRDINILLLGGVISPGVFTLGGGSNVLTALNVAGGISDTGSYRKIEHKRNGETIQILDLYDVFIDGNINFVNSLRAGDAILVHPIGNSIPVSGGVNNEAIFFLSNLVLKLKKYTNSNLIISGHSSIDGNSNYNQILSEKRANSVKEILINSGIDSQRLKTIGYGEKKPIKGNSRKQNRRVIISLN